MRLDDDAVESGFGSFHMTNGSPEQQLTDSDAAPTDAMGNPTANRVQSGSGRALDGADDRFRTNAYGTRGDFHLATGRRGATIIQ